MTITRIGTGLFWVLCLGVFAVSLRWLFAPLATVMEHMAHYLPQVPLALYGHILFAPLALALMPFQFWTGLRARRPRVHRIIGYSYVTSVLIGGVSALALLPAFLGSPDAAFGFALLAVAWIGATAMAVLAARAGDYGTHRRWMLRSAAMTFAAVTLRLIMPFLMMGGMSVTETYSITAWASWVPSLVLVEIYLRRRSALVA